MQAGQLAVPRACGGPRHSLAPPPCNTVYPRACGGNLSVNSHRNLALGLSPRVRGNRCQPNPFHYRRGSIPARAGEPVHHLRRSSGPTVYPRACGGTTTTADMNKMGQGLSPRVRGNLTRLFHYKHKAQGLSPRVRGNLFNDFLRHAGCRSIPERAGNRFPFFIGLVGERSIPARAGTAPLFGTASLQYGLSPRVRGNLVDQPQYPESKRSIPARAGESESHGLCSVVYWVYPRACGGTIPLMCCVLIFTGLSSRVRGNRSSSISNFTR